MFNNSIIKLQKRLLAVFVLISLIFIAILTRLAYVQLIKGQWLQAKAADQWTRDLPLKAKRGTIFDTNGNVIAENYTTYDIYIRARQVNNPSQVALTLSKILDVDYETTLKKAQNTAISESVVKLQVESNLAEKVIRANLSGVVLSENNKRYYPYHDLYTQVLGYTTIDNTGQAGLEAYADNYLKGVDGYALEESDVHGVKIDGTLSRYIPSISGMNVTTTLNTVIQMSVEKALEKLCEDHDPKTATAIVMNPKTGEILAMSTKPSFDLNDVPRDDVESLLAMSRNIGIVDVYEPGSTFKVLTTAIALEEGVTTENEVFYDPGYRIVDGEKIKCWKYTGHGSQTMTEGLCNSCNSVFVDLALRLGKETLYDYYEKFGFGSPLGVDFLGEGSGILMDIDSAKKVDYARMGFGQAIAVTPLQLINGICIVLNGGNLMKPYLIKNITDPDGKIIMENTSTVLNRVISEETSDRIKVMFEEVVKKYSGYYAFIEGYRVGGKTGTSQKYENGQIVQKYISSFVGSYPADDPEYVVLVVADEPSSGQYFGSVVATPYAKMIFQDIIAYSNDQPNHLEEDLQTTQKVIEMPNLIGKSITEAFALLSQLDLQFEVMGDGTMVIGQTPVAGTMVSKRAIVVLETV